MAETERYVMTGQTGVLQICCTSPDSFAQLMELVRLESCLCRAQAVGEQGHSNCCSKQQLRFMQAASAIWRQKSRVATTTTRR